MSPLDSTMYVNRFTYSDPSRRECHKTLKKHCLLILLLTSMFPFIFAAPSRVVTLLSSSLFVVPTSAPSCPPVMLPVASPLPYPIQPFRRRALPAQSFWLIVAMILRLWCPAPPRPSPPLSVVKHARDRRRWALPKNSARTRPSTKFWSPRPIAVTL